VNELKALFVGPSRLTLGVAESLTSGHVQTRIGAISGASQFFLGGVTAYTLEQKIQLLGVDRAVAEPVNCVSAKVAEQMARGACRLFGCSVSIATTGYAEPAMDWNVREPFAWWAIAYVRSADDVLIRSGCVECAGAERVRAQNLVADAAVGELIRAMSEWRLEGRLNGSL